MIENKHFIILRTKHCKKQTNICLDSRLWEAEVVIVYEGEGRGDYQGKAHIFRISKYTYCIRDFMCTYNTLSCNL